MSRVLDLRTLAAQAFGISPLLLPEGGLPGQSGKMPRLPKEHALADKDRFARPRPPQPQAELHGTGRGLLGLPVFCRVTFQPTRGTRGGFAGLELLDPIVSVSLPLNIISTAITGRVGTVKEYIGQGDYAVSIRGILATDPFAANRFDYPLPAVQTMNEMASLGVALPVSGWLMEVYGIKSLVIQNVNFEALPGFTNLQAYELQCLSDEPVELAL